jgi:hypothetical protein
MRRRTSAKTLSRMLATVAVMITALGALPRSAHAAPCAGVQRLQLRWSQNTGTALVSLSSTLCDRPPSCSQSAARDAGAMFTKSPITITIKDAAGHSLSGVIDAGASTCSGRCERVNRGGCLGGADTHRVAGSFVRYVVNTRGQATVVANKLKLPATEPPNLVAPISLSVTDGAGYAVTAELHKCRSRSRGNGVAISCAS